MVNVSKYTLPYKDGMGSNFCFLSLAQKKSAVKKLWYVGNCLPLACSFICLIVLELFLQGSFRGILMTKPYGV